jgi:hypothetical protein
MTVQARLDLERFNLDAAGQPGDSDRAAASVCATGMESIVAPLFLWNLMSGAPIRAWALRITETGRTGN